MQASPIIEVKDVHLTLPGKFHPVQVLRGVSLTIYQGETVAIVGPSGSGKTSLLMVLAGLEPPSRGDVMVDGMDMAKASEDELAEFRQRNVGVVFQSFHLIPTMSALENVMVPLELIGRADAYERARDLLSRVGLEDRMHHLPVQLSGGEQQRVALARAFAAEPGVLLADEPTGNLDAETGKLVVERMSDLQQEHNTTLILVTHNILLANACERQILIENGKIVSDKRKEQINAAA
jgi:putative ABC transport system ATP-binding protein